MMVRQIASPIPSPSGLLVMKGSKMDSSFSGGDSRAAVLHFDQHVRCVNRLRAHDQAPRAVELDLTHGAEGVEHQVQHDLLKLNVVALDREDVGRQVEFAR